MQQDIVARLEKLEKKNRFLQRMNFAFMAIFSIAALIGWTQYSVPKVIEAERFVLKDSTGKVKSAWYSEAYSDRDENYIQSRIEFYNNDKDTNITIGFKKRNDLPFVDIRKTQEFFDAENPVIFAVNIDPATLSLGVRKSKDSLEFGNGVTLTNLWDPTLSMYRADQESFKLSLQDTCMLVQRFGINPNIMFESNGKDDGKCLNCEKKLLKVKGK